MKETEQAKLLNSESEYISIGITDDGLPRASIGVPWENTGHAFNMKLPSVYLSPDDLRDERLMEMLCGYTVTGCYIFSRLDDYGFLSRFSDIRDLNIMRGEGIRDLDFLSGLNECGMLYLAGARLDNLDVIIDMKKRAGSIFGPFRCVGLCNCRVEDISRFEFESEKIRFSEFLIWNDKKRNERDRWRVVSANVRKYYEIEA